MRSNSKMRFVLQMVCGAAAMGVLLLAASAVAERPRIRFAFSETMIGDVNDSDAKIAINSWVAAFVRETSLTLDYDPVMISHSEQVIQKIRAHTLDSFALTTAEYNQVSSLLHPSIIIDQRDVHGGDEYVLLVHSESGITNLAGLSGCNLIQYKNAKMSLGGPWLETLLAAANQPGSDVFFGRKIIQVKLAKVILPVFFRHADACLVTRRGFEIMCELNPQLGKKLRVLAASPKVVSLLIGSHKDSPEANRQKFSDAVTGLYRSQSGRQLLTLFEMERLVVSDVGCLKSGVDLLAAYERLKGKPGVKK